LVNSINIPFFITLFRSALEKHDEQYWQGGHNFFLHKLHTGILKSPLRMEAKNSSNSRQLLRIMTVAEVPAAARL
jgi:hypothetical protein